MPQIAIYQPMCRLLNLIRLLFFADLATSTALWLAGGSSEYLEDNVTKFKMDQSVFDLALIRFLLAVSFIFLYSELENLTIYETRNGAEEDPSNGSKTRKTLCIFATFFFSLGSLVYSCVKFYFMYTEHKSHPKLIHSTYYILAFSSLAFSSVEFLVFFVNVWVLRRMSVKYSKMSDDEMSNASGNGKEKKKADLGRLLSLAKPEAWLLFGGSLALIVSSGSNMVAPLFFGKVIDASLKASMDPLNKTILILFIIYCAGGLASFFRSWLYTLAGQRLVARVRSELFGHIVRQEISFFDQTRTGELLNRLSSDSQVIQNSVTVNISMFVRYILQIVGSIAIMFAVSPKLTGVLLAVVPLVAIGAQRYGAYTRDLTKQFQDKLAEAATTAEESISNIRTVKAFSQEPKTAAGYAKDIDGSYQVGKRLALIYGIWNAVMAIFAQGAVTLVLWYGGKLVHDHNMSVGTLTSFMLYTLNVAMAFAFLSSLFGDFMKAVGASVRIFELFDRVEEIKSGHATLPSLEGAEIVFNDVFFHYPSRPDTSVLKGIGFCIKPGETIALVGPSGGGKSTIISMIERFYDPVEGTINIGPLHLPDVNLDWFRKKIGIVNQEPVLFANSIAENIAYGKDATEEEFIVNLKGLNQLLWRQKRVLVSYYTRLREKRGKCVINQWDWWDSWIASYQIIEAAKQANAHEFISTFEANDANPSTARNLDHAYFEANTRTKLMRC